MHEIVTIQARLKLVPDAGQLVGPKGRIQKAMDAAGIPNPNALARRIGEVRCKPVTPSTTYGWLEEDGSPPTAEYLVWLPAALGVDGHWLLTGEGDMERRPPTPVEKRYNELLDLMRKPLGED